MQKAHIHRMKNLSREISLHYQTRDPFDAPEVDMYQIQHINGCQLTLQHLFDDEILLANIHESAVLKYLRVADVFLMALIPGDDDHWTVWYLSPPYDRIH